MPLSVSNHSHRHVGPVRICTARHAASREAGSAAVRYAGARGPAWLDAGTHAAPGAGLLVGWSAPPRRPLPRALRSAELYMHGRYGWRLGVDSGRMRNHWMLPLPRPPSIRACRPARVLQKSRRLDVTSSTCVLCTSTTTACSIFNSLR